MRPCPLRLRSAAGFTLIELMIAVTIIGILAVIAVPSYQQYVYRANRAVAKTAIMKIYAQQESYYNDRKAFATTLGQLPDYSPSDATVNTVYLMRDGTTQLTQGTTTIYSLTLTAYNSSTIAACNLSGAAATTQYAILATPVNSQARDAQCRLLCAGSAGDKGATGTQSGSCWTR